MSMSEKSINHIPHDVLGRESFWHDDCRASHFGPQAHPSDIFNAVFDMVQAQPKGISASFCDTD